MRSGEAQEEGGGAGQACAPRGTRPASAAGTRWRRWRRARREAGPRTFPPPPPPRRAAGPVRPAARRARLRAGRGVEERGGEGAARPTMQSARRRRYRPVAKVKGRVRPPRPPWRRRPALRRAAALPRGLALTSGSGATTVAEQVPCLRRAPPARRATRGAGRAPEGRSLGGLGRPGLRDGPVRSGAAGRALAPPGSRRDRALLLFLSVKGQSS